MPIHSNLFSSKKTLEEQSFVVDRYKVGRIPKDDFHFKKLNDIIREISRQLRVLVVPYSPEETDYALALEPTVTKDFSRLEYPVTLIEQNEPLLKYPQQARELHYEAARRVLESHGMWRYTYNRYYEYYPEKIIDEYEIYRGFCFRYDLIEDRVLVTIDPLTRVITQGTVWELVSKLGKEEAKRKFTERYVLATQERGKGIYQIVKLDFETNVNDECITIEDKKYSVKGYFRRPGGKPELADLISDDEFVVIVRRKKGGKELNMAPSLLKLGLRTTDFPKERTLKQELRNEVYLSAERRRVLTQKFLTIINPLPFATGRSVEFDLEEISESSKEAKILSPPNLRFGGASPVLPDLSRYGAVMKTSLRRRGPAKKAAFSHNRLVLVYPSTIAWGIINNFYKDCKWVARNFFKTYLPYRPTFYTYPEVDVRKEYNSFRESIDAIIAVIQHEEETRRYLDFKQWFDKPNQVLTYRVINERYRLPKEQMGRYRNLILNVCAGLLGKMGGRHWVLHQRLSSDFYVGLDVGGQKKARVACYTFFDEYGNYLGEEWRPQRGEEVDPSELMRILVNAIKGYKNKIKSLVVHRDGEFRGNELRGIELARKEMIASQTMPENSQVVCVNVKKAVPFRLYEIENKKERGCLAGSYLVLDDHSGILATTGVPLLRQGIAHPLLLELVNPFDQADIREVMNDIYHLSFMHWGSIMIKMKLPATLRYADALTPFALRSIRIRGVPL